MARQETVVSVFIASPSDVSDERKVLDSVIEELNQTWSKTLKLRLEPIKWETHTHPSIGKYSQDVINTQIADDYDIFIATFWSKAGTQTPKEKSGTIEELNRAFELYKKGHPLEIMAYFKDQPIPPSKINTEQLAELQNTKKELGEKGTFYWTFENTEEFSSLLRMHLSRVAQKWAKSQPSLPSQEIPQYQTEETLELDEYGVFDHQEVFEARMSLVTGSFGLIAEATIGIGEKFTQRTLEIESLKISGEIQDRKLARKILKKSSDDLDKYSEILEQQVPIASKSREEAFEAFSKAISIQISDLEINNSDIHDLLNAIEGTKSTVIESRMNIEAFKNVVDDLPRLTIELNKSKRRASKALKDMLEEMNITLQSLEETITTLRAI